MVIFRFCLIIFLALFSIKANAQSNLPFVVDANSFSYSEDGSKLIAEGRVHVFANEASLRADKVVYDKNTGKIIATGNVIILDKELNSTFTEKVELTGDLKQAVMDEFLIIFNNSTGRLKATKAVKINQNKLNVFNASYTSCPLQSEQDAYPWLIDAKKISYDSLKERMIYKNATLKVLGLPVLYVPVFYHSTNPDKPISGFLEPSLASSSVNGLGFSSGYYYAINNNQDANFRAKYMGKRGIIWGAEHRYVGSQFKSDVRAETIADKEEDEHVRGMLKANAEYIIKPGRRVGLNANLASDSDYLDEFKDISDAYKSSTIYAEDASDSHYVGFSSRYFIDMRDDVDDSTLAQPLGRLQLEKVLTTDEKGGQIHLHSDMLALSRSKGDDMQRAIAFAEYLKPFYTPDGSLFEFAASVRTDYYSFNEDDAPSQTESRFLPEASISWEKPFASRDFKHILSPKVMFITSPEKDFSKVPNEDSTSFELDATNLFDRNRFSGYDRAETGSRVVYGIDTKYGTADKLNLHAFLGQSYNLSSKVEDIDSNVRSNNKNSDWVGFIKFEPNYNWVASTSFRLDGNSFAGQRVDSSLKYKVLSKHDDSEDDYVKLVHSFLKDDSEELNLYGYYNINEQVALRGRIQRNIYEEITLTQEAEVLYKSCCYNLAFKVRKKQSADDDTEDSLDFLVNFALLPTGKDK